MALKGNLRDVSLANLISVVCNDRGQARLRVISPQGEALVFLSNGGVVHAQMDSAVGEEVLFSVLGWDDGEFELEQDVGAPTTSIDAPLSSLLLQGMQRLDERSDAAPQADPPKGTSGPESLCAALGAVAGVAGVLVVARDGTLLAHSGPGNEAQGAARQAEQDGAVTVFVGNAASEIGEVMGLGSLASVIVDRGEDRLRVMVMSRPDYYVGLLLTNSASPAMVASRAGMLLV